MLRNNIIKYKDIIFLSIGTFLVIISLCLILYDKFVLLREGVFDEIALEKYREENKNVSSDIDEENTDESDDNKDDNIEVNTEIIDENTGDNVASKPKAKKTIESEFIGYLEIKKINLKQGLVSKTSYYNNVDRNIQILSASDYPDKEKGNFILASHSGSSKISYFKNLYKLSNGDEAVVFYDNYIYTYKIVNIYNVPKNGSVSIYRDVKKNTMTLITCTKNSKTEQTVYILELISKVKDGGDN